MANIDHVGRLKKGVKAWNEWRGDSYNWLARLRPSIRPDLQGVDFGFLRVFDWQRFTSEYPHDPPERKELHSRFQRGELDDDELRHGWQHLNDANLSYTDLSGAEMGRLLLRRANLCRATLDKANLSSTDLSGADLRGASLRAANLRSANLQYANLTRADLRGADLRMADLQGAILIEATLDDADLSGTYVYGVSAWDVSLTGTRQHELIFTPHAFNHRSEAATTVDDLEVAQFLSLLLETERSVQF